MSFSEPSTFKPKRKHFISVSLIYFQKRVITRKAALIKKFNQNKSRLHFYLKFSLSGPVPHERNDLGLCATPVVVGIELAPLKVLECGVALELEALG